MKSLRTKILAGFASMLALLMILTLIVTINLFNVNKKISTLNTNVGTMLDESRYNFNITNSSGLAGSYLLVGDKRYKELFTTYTELLAKIETDINSTNPPKEVQELFEKRREFSDIVLNEVFPAFDKGNTDLAVKIHREKVVPLTDNIIVGFNELVAKHEENVSQATNQLIKNGTNLTKITVALSVGTVIVGVIIAILLANYMMKPILQMVNRMNRIADGELSDEPLIIKSKDEIGQLSKSVNHTSSSLRGLIGSINDATEQIASSSEELFASAAQTTTGTEQVTYTAEKLATEANYSVETANKSAAVMEEMSMGIQRIAESSTNVSEVANKTKSIAELGNEKIQLSVQQMRAIGQSVQLTGTKIKKLDEHSQTIGEIINVINNISSQTNLLALNAAIEAARAGEHGKGFAVVASEVRKLAEQSAQSTNQIAELIKEIQVNTYESVEAMQTVTKEVESGSIVVNDAGSAFNDILEHILQVADNIQDVSATAQTMSAYSEEVSASVQEVKATSSQTSEGTETIASASQEQLAAMEEISSSAQALSVLAGNLQHEMKKFKI